MSSLYRYRIEVRTANLINFLNGRQLTKNFIFLIKELMYMHYRLGMLSTPKS
jgi:hypothetical protein